LKKTRHNQKLDRSKRPKNVTPDAEEIAWLDREIEKALAKIHIPKPEPVTPEEIERRRVVHERISALRDKIGPISVSTSRPKNVTPDAEEIAWLDREIEKAIAKIHIPKPEPVTAEEIERRRVVHERISALRDKIGPISVSTSDLIRELRAGRGRTF